MKPAPFRYLAPETIEEALALKAEHGDEARFLAGGQSLVPAMNFRLAQPAVLIDLNAIKALDFIESDGAGARIGALTRNATIEHDPMIETDQPLVHEAMPHVAHSQIRNRGTLGGNLANADPASEMPAVMLALGARIEVRAKHAGRTLDANDFFVGIYTTALASDEMLVTVVLPALAPRTGTCFLEVARRKGDFAMMGVAARVTLDADGRCIDAAWAYCNAGSRPIRVDAAARSLTGQHLSVAEIAAAARLAQAEIDPGGNVHASKAYQFHLAEVLTRRALATALARAR